MTAAAPSVKINVLASWVAHGATIIVGFFLMPYVIRILGDHQYGTWVFINTMASYAGLLYFGFGDTISRYVAKCHGEGDLHRLNQIVSLILSIYLFMSFVAILIAGAIAFAAPWISTWQGQELFEVRCAILVLGLNVAAGLCGSVFGGVLMGLRRFDLERGVSLLSDILRLSLIFVFLDEGWGILTMSLIFLTITVVENCLSALFAFRSLPQLRIHWSLLDWSVFKECSSFSSMAFLNAIAYQMSNATDSVVIGFALGTDRIVPYYVALRLAQFIKQPIDKVAQICMPTAGALSASTDRPRLHRFLLQAFGTVFLLSGGMFLGAWYFGGDVIATWMGPGYEESHHLLILLLGAQVISLPCNVLRAFLFALGQVRVPALLYLLEAVCNLTLSIVLCQFWGIEGVAWGTFIPVAILELSLLLPLSLKLVGVSFRKLWTHAVAPQLVPLAALAAYSHLISQWPASYQNWPMLLAITIGGGLVLGTTWLIAGRTLTPALRAAT